MTANTNAIFTLTPNNIPAATWPTVVTAANTAKDGTGTVTTVHVAGVNGSYVYKLVFQPIGTNTASVGRAFMNNGSTNATPGNNAYYRDVTLPASTLSEVATMPAVELPLNIELQTGHKINVTLGTAVAAGYIITAIAEDF